MRGIENANTGSIHEIKRRFFVRTWGIDPLFIIFVSQAHDPYGKHRMNVIALNLQAYNFSCFFSSSRILLPLVFVILRGERFCLWRWIYSSIRGPCVILLLEKEKGTNIVISVNTPGAPMNLKINTAWRWHSIKIKNKNNSKFRGVAVVCFFFFLSTVTLGVGLKIPTCKKRT